MHKLSLKSLGQIAEAEISFGDLTVFVGPQATGKSIALQALRLVLDTGFIQDSLQRHGIHWQKKIEDFFDVYFGGGMRSLWQSRSEVRWSDDLVDMRKLASHKAKSKRESLFFIPAQRVLALRDGWPRPFTDYSVDDPFAVRQFSEHLRLLLDQEFGKTESLFPQERRLKSDFRKLLGSAIFNEFSLRIDKNQRQKRLAMGIGKTPSLPYMVWSAGQREFVPLLLGLYWLLPPRKEPTRKGIEWVVIEEMEMGLHPQAIDVLILLVLELLKRGYRVCLSTHSTQVIEAIWALRVLQDTKGSADDLLKLFGTEKTHAMKQVAEAALSKSLSVYYFQRNGQVRDISALELDSGSDLTDVWGGLTEFSSRANAVVSKAMADEA